MDSEQQKIVALHALLHQTVSSGAPQQRTGPFHLVYEGQVTALGAVERVNSDGDKLASEGGNSPLFLFQVLVALTDGLDPVPHAYR